MTGAISLQRGPRPIEAWLCGLDERRAAAVLQYAETERSFVLSYLYARAMGMEEAIEDWEAFVLARWKKLDHRAILESEIMALHSDISEIRNATSEGRIRLGDAPTKISYLSRELRGHIEHLARDMGTGDRRALMLAGVQVVHKTLKKVFGGDKNAWPAIEAVVESAWAEIEVKSQPK